MNCDEAANRARKASRLVDAFRAEIRRLDPTVNDTTLLAAARALDPAAWLTLAEINGINPPSTETIAMVIAFLDATVRFPHPADPFAGLARSDR